MTKVLGKLTASLDGHFRDVWVVLHDSTCAYLADKSPELRGNLTYLHSVYDISQRDYSVSIGGRFRETRSGELYYWNLPCPPISLSGS
jgi:hypothetical protein